MGTIASHLLVLAALPQSSAAAEAQTLELELADADRSEAYLELADFPLQAEEGGLTNRVRLNVFSDATLGTEWGDFPDEAARARFEADGVDEFPVNSYGKGFGIVGADFVLTVDLTPDLVFQSEINFQVARGGTSEVEVDPERFYLDYRRSELVNLQVGLFFTPIGYHNRFLYSRAWLMHSVQVPDLFEEELNFVPTHTIGANLHGTFDSLGQTFHYILGVGNGRSVTPVENQFARDLENKEITALLEWVVPGSEEFLVGLSGWTSEIATFEVGAIGDSVDITATQELEEREVGVNPYLTYFGEDFNVLAELVHSSIGDDDFDGYTIEVSLNLSEDRFHPYVRYDRTDLPSGDQGDYYGLRLEGNTLTKHFIPEFEAGMLGANYDWSPNTRLKLEFIHHFDGVRPENALVFQVAWGY